MVTDGFLLPRTKKWPPPSDLFLRFHRHYNLESDKRHGLSLTTSGVCSCLFGSGTSRLHTMMFQTFTYMGVCMSICMCVCSGACLHRCTYTSRTHNIHIHAHTTHARVHVYTAVCACHAHTTHTHTHTHHVKGLLMFV